MSNEQCCELLASNLWMRWCLGGMPESLVIPKRSEESAFCVSGNVAHKRADYSTAHRRFGMTKRLMTRHYRTDCKPGVTALPGRSDYNAR